MRGAAGGLRIAGRGRPRRPLASCSHAMQHARWEVHGEGRALISVRSLPREDVGAARLELASAWPRSMRLCLDGKAVFWARVWSDHHGWTWLPNEPMPRVLPSFDAAEMRARASREHPWLGWIERMAPFIEELCGTRRPIDLVTGPGTSRYRELQASVTPSRSFAGGDDPWSAMPLPSRPWPSSDDGRVKAYRKLLREGVAPPVLLVWISGLRTSLVLDGHARMVAASLEACPIPSLTIVEAREEVRNAAHPALETVLSPLFADPRAARQAMETLDAATRPSWRAISRAVTMDIDVWRREVRRRLRAIPGDRREALARELLAP